MSSNDSSNGGGGARPRRSSFSQSTLSSVFQRGNSISGPSSQPIPVPNDPQRRRLSITTLGLSGTTPNSAVPYGIRRGSVSTNSGSIDEDAIDDDDGVSGSARTAPTPTTPFVRHMSFGAPSMRGFRSGGSPGNDQQGYNWSEQLRSRAESSVTGARPSFSFASGSSSPPRASVSAQHDRAKSVSEMPQPPVQAPTKPRQERPKPDAFQERILKGDFYMD